MHDEYTIELRKGNDPEAMDTVRSGTATTTADAVSLIEAFRDRAAFRDDVTWRSDEVDGKGDLFGLAPGGVIWQVHVTPDLNTELVS
jgi:hypothetical protein